MSIEVVGTDVSAVDTTAPTPTSPAPAAELDHNGFSAEDRAAASAIFSDDASSEDTNTPAPVSVANTPTNDLSGFAAALGLGSGSQDDLTRAIDALVRLGSESGYAAPAQPDSAPAVPAASTVQDKGFDFSLADADLKDTDPEVAAVLKTLSAKQADAINKVLEEARNATKLAQEAKQQWDNVKIEQEQHAVNEVVNRAGEYLLKVNPSRYGKPGERSIVQRMEYDAISKVASDLIAGMTRYGIPVPTIEQVMQAAVLRYEGSLPVATANKVAPPPQPRGSLGRAPAVKSGIGSTSVGDVYMGDADFVNAARALLNG